MGNLFIHSVDMFVSLSLMLSDVNFVPMTVVVRRSVSALQTLTSCCKCKKILMTKLPDKDKW